MSETTGRLLPTLVVVEVGHEEAAVGELGGLLRVLGAGVDTASLELRALERDHLHRDGRVLQDGELSHLRCSPHTENLMNRIHQLMNIMR